jgi:hypothetical protein
MAKFLNTAGIIHQADEMMRQARRELFLVTPFLQLSQTFSERLAEAARRGVRVTIIYGKEALRPEERTKLEVIERLDLRYLENLHAKCYLGEDRVVVASMNLYEYSSRNREMGVMLTRAEEPEAFEEARSEVHSILSASQSRPLRAAAGGRVRTGAEKVPLKHGYCIRCADPLAYMPDRPLCRTCYSTWAQWENEEYEENFCHRCGQERVTSFARPLCSPCFRAAPFAASPARSSGFR